MRSRYVMFCLLFTVGVVSAVVHVPVKHEPGQTGSIDVSEKVFMNQLENLVFDVADNGGSTGYTWAMQIKKEDVLSIVECELVPKSAARVSIADTAPAQEIETKQNEKEITPLPVKEVTGKPAPIGPMMGGSVQRICKLHAKGAGKVTVTFTHTPPAGGDPEVTYKYTVIVFPLAVSASQAKK